jgi:putative ABC transport system permease protein
MSQLPNVVEVYPEYRFTGDARLGDEGRLTRMSSLPVSAASNDAFEGMLGSFFTSPDAHEIILQTEMAESLAEIEGRHAPDMLGREIVLRYPGRQQLPESDRQGDLLGYSIVQSEIPLKVVGIISAEVVFSTPGAIGRSGAFMPLAVAEELRVVQGEDMDDVIANSIAGAGNQYENLTIRVDRASAVPAVQEAVRQMGFNTFSLLDFAQSMRRVFAILDLLLGIFGSLALAVASLGIVNTLVMAILERRREIGVLKALGASDRDVRQLFFAEASVMGLAGGVFGIFLGWAIGRIIQFVTATYIERQGIPAENIWLVPWWLVAGALVFSLAISLAAGMYPAARAAKLDPVEALRYQ